ncbi:hypothetical protein BH20GEM2_BH20GEM2_03500 [soil metagenome]
MGVRSWFFGADDDAADAAALRRGNLMDSLLGRQEEKVHALGEYDASSYPEELRELLVRREAVAQEVIAIDPTDPAARAAAVPRLKELLARYPHPLVYELLLHAYLEAGRVEEAKGVAFAARERRHECARSPHPEIRAETDRLREWSPEEVEQLHAELRSGGPRR